MGDATDWTSIYRRYVTLEKTWSLDNAPPPVARQVLRGIIHGHQDESTLAREIDSLGLKPPGRDLLDEAYSLHDTLYPAGRKRPAGRHQADPLEDVYAAALSMLPHGFWVESPDRGQVYRGQRNAHWSTIPSLFRKADTSASLTQLAEAVTAIRSAMPELDEVQGVALAQHYSLELNVATWLLDVTYDPRVALFFASHHGEDGDVGVVSCIGFHEWEELSAGGTNRLGQLRVIDVPGVLRIERQRASFLDTSHPDLFEQYVGHAVWFRQVEGLTFEDLEAENPVSDARLYPADDPMLETLRNARPSGNGSLEIGPAGDAREPLSGPHYLEIARSWCHAAGVDIDIYRQDTLAVVCDVHAHLQRLRDDYTLPQRSLLRLHDAVEFIIRAQQRERYISPHEALSWSVGRLAPDQREKFEDIITHYARARDLC